MEFRAYRNAFLVSIVLSLAGCSSSPMPSYDGLYTAPIPSGYTKKDDLMTYVRPELKESFEGVREGMKVNTRNIIPHSDTKIGLRGVRTKVPWKALENALGQKD